MLEHKYLKRSCCYGAWLAVLISVPGFITGRADGPVLTGAEIYRQKCASCHGASGEGTRRALYPRALIGERPVPAFARLIAKTMPEDAPGECVGEDAPEGGYLHLRNVLFQECAGAEQISTSSVYGQRERYECIANRRKSQRD